MNEPNSIPTQLPISGYQVRWFSRRLKFVIWFPIVLVAAFAAGYLFWQKTLVPWPYDLEPVNLLRNGVNNQLEGWQTYTNEIYGFEMKYPEFLEFDDYGAIGQRILGISFTKIGHEVPAIYIEVLKEPAGSLVTSARKRLTDFGKYNNVVDSEYLISGVDAKIIGNSGEKDFEENIHREIVLPLDGQKSLVIVSVGFEISFLNQILSTFRFIEARNSDNSQGISDDLVKKFVTDTVGDYKIYHNDKYGFEFEFPIYFKPVNINSEEFHGESNRLDWIDIIVYPQSPSGFEYVNQSGGFIFRYDAMSDKWISTQSGVPLKFAPQKLHTDKNLPYYYVKTGDAAAVEEKTFIFNLKAKFVLEISVSRNMSYVDCISPCPEKKPLSDSETITQVLSTFKFVP